MPIVQHGRQRLTGAPAGATPAWGSAGTPTADNTANATHNVAHPSAVAANELLICHSYYRTGTSALLAMTAGMSSAGWAHIPGSPWVHSAGSRCLLVAWKNAVGDEGGTNIPGGITDTQTGTGQLFYGVCHRWTAAGGFRANPFENILHAEGSGTTITMPTVTPQGSNRRAVFLMAMIGDLQNLTEVAGETGGQWVKHLEVETDLSGDATLQVQSSDQSGGGAILGGTMTCAGAVHQKVSFALVPAGG